MPKRAAAIAHSTNLSSAEKRGRNTAVMRKAEFFNFSLLPDELQLQIWRYLDDRSSNNLHLVCRTWRRVCQIHVPFKLVGCLQLSIDQTKFEKAALVRVARGNCQNFTTVCSIRHVKFLPIDQLGDFLDTITFSAGTGKTRPRRSRNDGEPPIRRELNGGTLDLLLTHRELDWVGKSKGLFNTGQRLAAAGDQLLGIISQCRTLQPKGLVIHYMTQNYANFYPAMEKLHKNGCRLHGGLERLNVGALWSETPKPEHFPVILNDRLFLPTLTHLLISCRSTQAAYTAEQFLNFIRLNQHLRLPECQGANGQWLLAAVQKWRALAQQSKSDQRSLQKGNSLTKWTLSIVFTKDHRVISEALGQSPAQVETFMILFGSSATWHFVEGECKLEMKIEWESDDWSWSSDD